MKQALKLSYTNWGAFTRWNSRWMTKIEPLFVYELYRCVIPKNWRPQYSKSLQFFKFCYVYFFLSNFQWASYVVQSTTSQCKCNVIKPVLFGTVVGEFNKYVKRTPILRLSWDTNFSQIIAKRHKTAPRKYVLNHSVVMVHQNHLPWIENKKFTTP